ncbi:MAG TPA: FHA domain-containing protein, partial [Anaerolineales bacterium]|nr:FHA domain-containing protein [Anaerolineales bacterium]
VGTILWDGATAGTLKITPNGFSVAFTVPGSASPGQHTITVCWGSPCTTGEFAESASAVFTVDAPAPTFTPVAPSTSAPVAPPQILSFALDAPSIPAGSCTQARWQTQNANSVTLSGEFGTITVPLSGEWQLCPPQTTSYTLRAFGFEGASPAEASAQVTLIIDMPTPTVTPVPPTPTLTSVPPRPTFTPVPPRRTFTPTPPTPTPTPGLLAPLPGLLPFRTPRFTLVPSPTPTGWCADLGLGPEAVVLDFEEPLTVQEERYGVSFERTGQVIVPPVAARSGTHALRSVVGMEFGSINNPILMWFSRPVAAVGMFVGLEEALSARGEITARLSVYGYRAGSYAVTRLGTDEDRFPARRTPVRYCLRFQAGEGEVITGAALEYLTADGASAYEPRLMDDLTVVYSARDLPGADRPPGLWVYPGNAAPPGGYQVFQVEVDEDRSLRRMWYQVGDGAPVELPFWRRADAPTRYWAEVGIYFPGYERYGITFSAEDSAGQVGTTLALALVPTPRPPVDIEAVAAEAVQVVQCLNDSRCSPNSVPLVADKPTLVRLYLRLAGGTLRPADAVAGLVCRIGSAHCVRSFNTVVPDADPDPLGNDRGDLNATLNFLLPPEWVSREVSDFLELTVTTLPPGSVGETDTGNNEVRLVVRIVSPRVMKVYFVPVSVGGVAPLVSERVNMADWISRVYPVSQVQIWTARARSPVFVSSLSDTSGGGCGRDWSRMMSSLDSRRNFELSLGQPGDVHILGMVSQGVPGGTGGTLGCGNTPGWVASSIVTPGQRFGGQVAAQELAHNKGLTHAPGCNAGRLDERYPVGDGTLDVWGIDVGRLQLYPPSATFDHMGYCGGENNTWTSRYTYLNLMRLLPALAADPGAALARLAAPARQQLQDFVVVGGVIYPDSVDLVTGPYRMTLTLADDTPSGPYIVEMLDGDGKVLYSRDFRAAPLSNSDAPDVGTFYLTLPVLQATQQIVFRYQGNEIARLSASAAAPTVELLAPLGGEDWGASGAQTIRWQAQDPDGDPLRFTLQASDDGGERWATLALDLQGVNEYTLDAADLGGGSYILRILATDGFHTAEDRTEAPVRVASKLPEVYLAAPQDGATFPVGEMVIFQGFATDLEDGVVEDEAYVWSSDVDGELGSGSTLWALSLTPGEHAITLTVSDRDGMSASASVRIVVLGSLAAVEPEPTGELATPEAATPAPDARRFGSAAWLLALVACGAVLSLAALVWLRRMKSRRRRRRGGSASLPREVKAAPARARLHAAGRWHELQPSGATLGRGSECEIVLTNERISRRHASIRLESAGWAITDLGSSNGTFLNEARLEPNTAYRLAPGDQILLGGTGGERLVFAVD